MKKSKNKALPSVKTAAPNKAPSKTVVTQEKESMTEYVIVNLICLFVFLAFGYIAVMSMFQTSHIDPAKYKGEHILFQMDIVPLNIIVTALFFVFLFAIRRFYDFFAKVNIRVMEIALAAVSVTLGLIWVLNVRSVPSADSANVFFSATGAAKDDFTQLQSNSQFYFHEFYKDLSYYHFYPFQLGFVFLCEIVYRIFGTDSSMPIQIINVLCVAASYFALARMTGLLFKRKAAEFIAIVLLLVCFQPILFCTFAYGNIAGMCAAIWASLLLIKYFQTEKYGWAIGSGALLVLATLAKYNNMIYLVAFVIVLLVHIVKKKKWQSAVIAAAMVAAVLLSNTLVIKMYESRAEMQYESGVSQVLYLDMGLQDSSMAPGWYTTIGKDTYLNRFLEPKLRQNKNVTVADANKAAWDDIGNRLNALTSDGDGMLDFFSKKILSQWNEPTFESVWVSKVKRHTASEEDIKRLNPKMDDEKIKQLKASGYELESGQMEGIVKSVYEKSLGQILEFYFNIYMQIVYIMFAAGIYLLFIHKKTNIETVILPLVLLGAFGYHMLFEGKSQYILTYIPLLIPTASYAFMSMLNGKYEKVKKIFEKVNHHPDRFDDI